MVMRVREGKRMRRLEMGEKMEEESIRQKE